MSEVSEVLSRIKAVDPTAPELLLPLVYDELRKLAAVRLAREDPGHTLQATALVHEAYVRLVDVDRVQKWNSRGHFFAAAAEAMRRILVERARAKCSLKYGGAFRRVALAMVVAGKPANLKNIWRSRPKSVDCYSRQQACSMRWDSDLAAVSASEEKRPEIRFASMGSGGFSGMVVSLGLKQSASHRRIGSCTK